MEVKKLVFTDIPVRYSFSSANKNLVLTVYTFVPHCGVIYRVLWGSPLSTFCNIKHSNGDIAQEYGFHYHNILCKKVGGVRQNSGQGLKVYESALDLYPFFKKNLLFLIDPKGIETMIGNLSGFSS